MSVKRIVKKDHDVYRGFNLFDYELDAIISSLEKAKPEGYEDIISYFKRRVEEAEREG